MPEHGTRSKYVADGCRCKPCTYANAAYTREWARKTRADAKAWRELQNYLHKEKSK